MGEPNEMRPQGDGVIYIQQDEISNRLDEMEDLCKYWKLCREKGNDTPGQISALLVILANGIASLDELEKKSGPRMEG
jgi:hypothetical protein